jgi:hypothetical protein
MKNLITISLLIVLATSCTTLDKCNRKYPPVESSSVKDSIVTETITKYKDSLIYLRLDPDTITLISTEYISDPDNPKLIYIDSISAENKFSQAWAWVEKSSLGLSLVQKDTTLEFLLDDAVRETEHWKQLYHSEIKKEVKVVRFIPKFYRFCSIYFYITATALIILAFVKLKKFLPF